MAKKKNDYFEMIADQTSYCVKAAILLGRVLDNYDYLKIDDYREEMHSIEHAADEVRHDILAKLSTEFITPIDQEDILRLVQIIDDITDALDEVVLELYMYHIVEIPAQAKEMAELVNRCVGTLHEATEELKNFKKSDTLRGMLVRVNDIEAEADNVYLDAVHALFLRDADGRLLWSEKSIYDSLENCCDLCEDTADIIEQTVIKNT